MFRWYRESTKCYVYLSDVSRPAFDSDDLAWEVAFRISKWFTRGWTLQELIAPTSVEFFSKDPRNYLEEHKFPLYGVVIEESEEDDTAALKITSQWV
ncbi:hypothetical protein N431DRAFT_480117 [Stipitochalara longipes BDJ]|nr:hypothetical protein N431DRAFT_480117 [Stipitochalara longipes BDJ]